MKIISFISALSFILLAQTAVANDNHDEGKQLYKTHCDSCHGVENGMDMSKRVAPPIFAVKMHYIGTYADKDSFVMAIANWLETRDESNSLMFGAIRRFKVMPAVEISRENAEKVAAYIYAGNLDSPEGFQQHYEEMHGKKL